MAHLKSRSRWRVSKYALMLVAAMCLATPGLSACAEGDVTSAKEPLPIGEAAKPRPTLMIDLGETEKDSLRRASFSVRLAGVMVDGETVTGFHVFVNAPDANADTPVEDPSYVTSFSFFPAPAKGEVAGTFVVNLEPSLARLALRKGMRDTLTLTLVPIGTEDAAIGLSSSEIFLGQP